MNKIAIFGALLLILTTVQAATISGNFDIEVLCSTPTSETYILKNDSGSTHTYSITAIGETAGWVNMNGVWIGERPLAITIAAGQSKELHAFIKPQTCYITPGNYIITIKIDGTTTKEIEVEVLESRVLKLEVTPTEHEVKQCDSAEFDLKLTNTGESDEAVQLSVEGIDADWVTLSTTGFLLEEGQSHAAKLLVEPDCGAEAKEHAFKVKAALKGTSFFTIKNAKISIEDEQGIEMTAPTLTACNDRETTEQLIAAGFDRQCKVVHKSIELTGAQRMIPEIHL